MTSTITIKRATKEDYPAIHALIASTGKMVVTKEHLNARDLAIQARNEEGEVVGFVWAGLMASGTIAYMNLFAVDPRYAGQGLGNQMALELFKLGLKRGVRQVLGVIRRDEYHDKSAINALKLGIGADATPYTLVCGDMNHMYSELTSLKEVS